MHGNLPNFSERLENLYRHLHSVTINLWHRESSNSIHVGCGLNALYKLRGILSGTGSKWGLWVSSSNSTLSGPQANSEAFLAWTYEVKSPVIKQLEALLWGDLVQWGKCQSDCNQDLCRSGSWWHSATLTSADSWRLIILAQCSRVRSNIFHEISVVFLTPTFIRFSRTLFCCYH